MRARRKNLLLSHRGQSAIETALALPFLIYLIYYTINAFLTIHTAHVGQKYSAMNLYQRLDNRAKFVVDALGPSLHDKEYMAVQYSDFEGAFPRRKILLETENDLRVRAVVGICREPIGVCGP